MLWAFGGNLNLELTPRGIRAEITALCYLDTAFFGLVPMIAAPLTVLSGHGDGSPQAISTEEVIGAILLACAGFAVLVYAQKGGSTTVSLDANELRIVRRRFGIDWRTRVFPTGTVRNLSYLPPKDPPFLSRSRGLPGEICFDSGKRSYRFGAGIDFDDAKELIRQMTQVYKFPWDLPEER